MAMKSIKGEGPYRIDGCGRQAYQMKARERILHEHTHGPSKGVSSIAIRLGVRRARVVEVLKGRDDGYGGIIGEWDYV